MIQLKCIKFRIRICVEPDEEGYYAYCPELKGIHEEGSSVEEATENAKESALVLLQSILEDGAPLPICVEEIDASFKALVNKAISGLFPKHRLITKIEDLDISDLSFA